MPAGTLPAELALGKHRIWGEDIPSDIEPFEGERVVVTPPAYKMHWNTARMFDHLKASVEVMQVFTNQETRDYLLRPGAVPK